MTEKSQSTVLVRQSSRDRRELRRRLTFRVRSVPSSMAGVVEKAMSKFGAIEVSRKVRAGPGSLLWVIVHYSSEESIQAISNANHEIRVLKRIFEIWPLDIKGFPTAPCDVAVQKEKSKVNVDCNNNNVEDLIKEESKENEFKTFESPEKRHCHVGLPFKTSLSPILNKQLYTTTKSLEHVMGQRAAITTSTAPTRTVAPAKKRLGRNKRGRKKGKSLAKAVFNTCFADKANSTQNEHVFNKENHDRNKLFFSEKSNRSSSRIPRLLNDSFRQSFWLKNRLSHVDNFLNRISNEWMNSPGMSNVYRDIHIDNENIQATTSTALSKRLRPVVVDGSNVAFGHGRLSNQSNPWFSIRGVEVCVNSFLSKGHSVKVFLPEFRLKNECSIMSKLKEVIVATPCGDLNGKRYTCYDDRYMVQEAVMSGAVIVSNDLFRDLRDEDYLMRAVIDHRRLPFGFRDKDTIMYPKDPRGKVGPGLDAFLRV